MTNIFNLVKTMVNHNITEEYSNDSLFLTGIKMTTIKSKKNILPQVKWLVDNKIVEANARIEGKGWEKEYIVEFTHFNLEHKFFIREKRRTLLASQMMEFNDSNRQDDNRTYSQSRVDDEYYYQDETKYEKIDKADSCTYELYVQSIGFSNYEEFKKEQEAGNLDDQEVLDFLYRNFLERNMANEWQYGEEEELEIA